MRVGRWITSTSVAVLAFGVAACEPPPPRLQLAVTTTQWGQDDAPGDGVCASGQADGECTLQAALQEGATAPHGVDITLPAGEHQVGLVVVAGDVAIIGPADGDTRLVASIDGLTVPAGDSLRLVNLNRSFQFPVPLHVHGTVHLERSVAIADIAEGASLLATDSVIREGPEEPIVNGGRLVLVRSSVLRVDSASPDVAQPVIAGGPASSTALWGSAVVRPGQLLFGSRRKFGGGGTCTGPAPSSFGYSLVEVPCGPLEAEGDLSGTAGVDVVAFAPGDDVLLGAGSPLVDAIPLGHQLCPSGVALVDVFGNPRGVDGNGDGVAGCDIGAVEHQPAP